MKNCKKCKKDKESCEFGKNKSAKDGFDHYCSICRKEYNENKKYNRKEYFRQYKRKDKNSSKRKKFLKTYMMIYRRNNKSKFDLYRRYDKIYSLLRIVLKYKKSKKLKSTEELLGWLKGDFFSRFPDIPEKHHVDHKIPISWFLEESPVSIINNLENLHILPGNLNLSKGNRFCHPVSDQFYEVILPYIKPKYKESLQKL